MDGRNVGMEHKEFRIYDRVARREKSRVGVSGIWAPIHLYWVIGDGEGKGRVASDPSLLSFFLTFGYILTPSSPLRS
jgi:hypothetical protein